MLRGGKIDIPTNFEYPKEHILEITINLLQFASCFDKTT